MNIRAMRRALEYSMERPKGAVAGSPHFATAGLAVPGFL
jgi:hypothetical protein